MKGQMDMAREELKKTQDLLNLLTDSQTVRCKTTIACLIRTSERMPQPAPPRDDNHPWSVC